MEFAAVVDVKVVADRDRERAGAVFAEEGDVSFLAVYLAVEGEMQVHFIDVGQADCALISLNGANMLIDGGNVDDGPDVVRFIKNLGIDTLHPVVATHAHEDHVGGLSDVLSEFTMSTPLCFTPKAFVWS